LERDFDLALYPHFAFSNDKGLKTSSRADEEAADELEDGRESKESERSIVSPGYNGNTEDAGDVYPFPLPTPYSFTFPLEHPGEATPDIIYEGEGCDKGGGERHTPFFRMTE